MCWWLPRNSFNYASSLLWCWIHTPEPRNEHWSSFAHSVQRIQLRNKWWQWQWWQMQARQWNVNAHLNQSPIPTTLFPGIDSGASPAVVNAYMERIQARDRHAWMVLHHNVEHQCTVELLKILADLQCPDYMLQKVLMWTYHAKLIGFAFNTKATSDGCTRLCDTCSSISRRWFPLFPILQKYWPQWNAFVVLRHGGCWFILGHYRRWSQGGCFGRNCNNPADVSYYEVTLTR